MFPRPDGRAVGERVVAVIAGIDGDGVVQGRDEVVREQHPLVGGDGLLHDPGCTRIDGAQEVFPHCGGVPVVGHRCGVDHLEGVDDVRHLDPASSEDAPGVAEDLLCLRSDVAFTDEVAVPVVRVNRRQVHDPVGRIRRRDRISFAVIAGRRAAGGCRDLDLDHGVGA